MESNEETQPQKQTLCLNMIVKDESHIIKASLKKLTDKVHFDYWVISDTGSSDNTPDIITQFFKEHNIPGELHHDKWIDFGHNRTKALEHAYNKTDYLLVFDADDEIFGNFMLPPILDQDAYKLIFGNSHTYSYERPLIINNRQKWQYLGVLHEYLDSCGRKMTMQTICGDYSILSGRSGNRSSDPDKYLKDAIVLEKAYKVAVDTKGPLQDRYAFYCANSYFDYGKFDKAAEWYKTTLTQNGWDQEKYIACLKLYKCYKRLGEIEKSHYYLVKSHNYDGERMECVYKLIVHHCCENQNEIAFKYYSFIKDYYENKYILENTCNKLFVDNRVANFYLPYYMIIISERTKHFDTGVKMFQIIFIKKMEGVSQQHVGNLLFNFKFFTGFLCELKKEVPQFAEHIYNIFNDYILFLISRGYNLKQYDFFSEYADILNITNQELLFTKLIKSSDANDVSESESCENSKNVLFFAGFCDKEWNYTFGLNNALGGSERAVNFLASSLPKDYTIFVSGNVKEETVGNVKYIHLFKLNALFKTTKFHTIIVSRYISFYEMFPTVRAHKSYIWAHDTTLVKYGCNIEPQQILEKWDKKITGAICLTQWHADCIIEQFPTLKNKMNIINNGIVPSLFIPEQGISFYKKINNLFVYTSCPERGLMRLLELWPKILELLPDAHLKISSYNEFPSNNEDKKMQNIINNYPNSIHHCGKLNPTELYKLMGEAEYWLYPCNWPETSCITALEMLYSGAICLYYPCAGLTETMDKYGFKMIRDQETILLKNIASSSKEEKERMIESGKNYALSCSWDKRAITWEKLILGKTTSVISNHLYTCDTINSKNLSNISNLCNVNYLQLDCSLKQPSDKPLTNNVAIVTAFIDIGRGKWSNWERDEHYYVNSFLNYLNIDYKMVVFIDEKYIFKVLKAYDESKFKNKIFIPINKEWVLTNIYAWKQLEKDNSIITSQEYKNSVGDLLKHKCPENIYSEYNIVNHSKIDFINYVIDNNLTPPGCDFICWSDFGVHRAIYITNKHPYPENVIDVNMLNPNKITICSRSNITEQHADPLYILQSAPSLIQGSFFGGSIKVLKEFQNLYHEALQELYDINISDDDQHVYIRCFLKRTDLFDVYLTNAYPNALKYFEYFGGGDEPN